MFFKEFFYKSQTQTFTQNKLFAWGFGTSGQLGAYGNVFSLAQVSIGTSHALAVTTDGRMLAWGQNTAGQLGDGTTVNKNNPTQIGLSGWKKVAAGNSHSVALRADGYIFVWGLNNTGQLGLNNVINRSSPVQLGSEQNWIDVEGTFDTSVAINAARELYIWGLNSNGQIGDGTTTNKSNPVLIASDKTWTKVSVGVHSVGITFSGELYAWGLNNSGQLGNISTINRSSPVLISSSGYKDFSVGSNHVLAITSTDTLWVWGGNLSGQLGNNSIVNRSSPIQLGTSSYSFVAAGWSTSAAITSDGKLFTWGRNSVGEMGNGTTISRSSPIQIASGSSFSIVANSLGAPITIATLNTKVAYAWGQNLVGALGDNTLINKSSPVLITNTTVRNYSTPIQVGSLSWTSIASGGTHALALRSDNLLFAWGLGTSGQLGDNTAISKSSPVQIGTSSWTAVAAGLSSSLAIRSDTTLWAWGLYNDLVGAVPVTASWKEVVGNSNTKYALRSDNTIWGWGLNNGGQLANNTTLNRSIPIQIGSGISWRGIASASDQYNAFFAIADNYTAYAAGINTGGQFGNNQAINRSNLVQVMADKSWSMISGGLGITVDGALWSWGVNNNGTLGLGDTISRSSPTQVLAGTSFSQVYGGFNHVFAIANDGIVYGWGRNATGELGDGTTISKSSPVTLVSPFDTYSWLQVVPGGADTLTANGHTLAIRNDNTLYAWGLNSVGQLGTNNIVNRSSPFQVGTSSYSLVAAGASRSLAVDINGIVYGWGLNNFGQVGDLTTINKSSPVVVSTLSFSKITSDWFGAAAIREDGVLYVWGANNLGNLGDGTTVNKSTPTLQTAVWTALSSPVQIGALSSYSQISASNSNFAAIRSDGSLYVWGNNATGQTGLNLPSTNTRFAPIKIDNNSWLQVSVGSSHLLAIKNNNQLYAWGGNANYQIGDNSSINKSSPVLISSESWVDVSAGANHSLAIKSDGGLWAWGNSAQGQTGIITDSYSWTQVGQGLSHTIGLRNDGTIWTWGINNVGQLGDNTAISKSSPVQIGTSSWTQVSANGLNTAAIRIDGTLWSWGNNNSNLGDGTTIAKSSPVQLGTSSWTQVSVGLSHSLAIDANGRLFGWGIATALNVGTATFSWAIVSENTSHVAAIRSDGLLFVWGLNSSGQIGDSTTISKSSPIQIGTNSWISVSAGVDHTLGVASNNMLFAWGGNSRYQLGDGTTVNKSSPSQIGTSSWLSVTAANSFSMAIDSNNGLYAWGLGTSGQLGTLTETYSWSTISAGSSTAFAIRNDSVLYGWGLNTGYQIGDGSSITKSSPVLVAGSLSWNQVSAGFNHTLGITNTGALYGWGTATTGATGNYSSVPSWIMVSGAVENFYGIQSDGSLWSSGGTSQTGGLGLNDTLIRSSPTQIGTSSYIFVSAGGGNTQATAYAITADYKLFGWGANETGQLGQNDTINRSIPVQIGVGSSWIGVTAGASHGLFIKDDYTLWGTGSNQFGKLGVNDSVFSRSNLVQIGTSSWKQVAAAISHSLGIMTDDTLWAWGEGSFGKLGNNSIENRSSPVQVTSPGTAPWLAVAANNDYSLAITGAGLGTPYSVYSWGANVYGQLGLNSAVGSISTPTLTKAGAAGASFTQVATNKDSNTTFISMALTNDGKMWVWGYGAVGYLGDNAAVNRSSPVLVAGTTSFSQLAQNTANRMTYALATDNTLWQWGIAPFYISYYPTFGLSSPVQVGGSIRFANYNYPVYTINSEPGQGSWSQISAGNSFSLGIKNNLLYGWGRNDLGQTGTNLTTTPILSPIQVGSNSWSIISASELGDFAGGIDSSNKLYMWGNGEAQTSIMENVTPFSWAQIAFGNRHAVAIKSDGGLYTWGQNDKGQLAQNNTINQSSPIQIGTGNTYIGVAAGAETTYAIRDDYTLWSAGDNQSGALGINIGAIGTTRSNLVQVAGSWASVAAGTQTAFAIRTTGSLFSWGQGIAGALGLGDTLNRSSPVQIGTGSWRIVSASGTNAAAITQDGTLWVWGSNTSGQLANNSVVNRSSPILVSVAAITFWNTVTISSDNTASAMTMAAIGESTTRAGALYIWGGNAYGALGDGTTISKSTPVPIGTSVWTQVIGMGQHFMGLTDTNQLFVWGRNNNGQLGLNDTINRSSPVQISAPAGASWKLLSKNSAPDSNQGTGSYAIDSNSNMWVWGRNDQGQLGLGDKTDLSSPVQLAGSWTQILSGYISYSGLKPILPMMSSYPVQIGNDSWSQLSVGASHSLAIRADGSLWAWGINNSSSQLGLNDTINRSSPTQIGSLSWLQVSAGANHSMAIKSDYTLWGWGNNTFGQVGLTTTAYSWIQIANTGLQSHGIRSDGLLFAWGQNNVGQLGDNSVVDKSSPVQVGSKTWKKVYNNISHTVAIDTDDNLYTWGLNNSGQLGNNTAISRSSPVAVIIKGTGSWVQAFVGSAHTTAIQTDGSLWSWGGGLFVGDSTTIAKSSPVQIGTSSWTMVGGALSATAAIDSNGRLFTWGQQSLSASGLLGVNDTLNRSSPTLIAGTPNTYNWTYVSSGGANHIMAITNYGAMFGMGFNTQGQLGDNTVISRSSATLVTGSTSWTKVGCGFSFTIASATDGSLWAWGNNDWGQATYNVTPTAANRSNPVQVIAESPAVFSTGQYNTAVIISDQLFNWGYNLYGMLGDSSVVAKSSPTQIGNNADINTLSPVQIGTSSWSQVSAGNQFTLARDINNNLYAWGQDSSGQLGL